MSEIESLIDGELQARVKAKLAEINRGIRESFGEAPTLEQHITVLYNLVAGLMVQLDLVNDTEPMTLESLQRLRESLSKRKTPT